MTTKKQPEPSLLAEYIDVAAMAAEADEERPRASETLLSEFLDVSAPVPVPGRASPAEIRARQIFLDVADRLGAPTDREAA